MNYFSHPHRFRKFGFSALELTAVVLVMLILSMIAAAGVQMIGRQDPVSHSARRLVHAFGTARSYAIAHNSTYTVQIDMDHYNFWIDETTQNAAVLTAKVIRPQPLDRKMVFDQVLRGAMSTSVEGLHTVRFFPDGSSDDLSLMLRRADADGTNERNISTVRIYGPTGQTRIFENRRLEPSIGSL